MKTNNLPLSLKKIKTFTDNYPYVGPIMWILSIQYFLLQILVARAFTQPYSFLNNTISDLGNTHCGIYSGRYLCSPLHELMNGSFIVLGLFMTLGSMLIYKEFKESKLALVGFSFMFLAGIGTLFVGIFPENTVSSLHAIGAFLPFFVGNIGLIVLGAVLEIPFSLKLYTIISGIISLVGLSFFVTHNYIGLGIGGMERITAYPQTLWLIVFGIYISKNHYKSSMRNSL
jgi:hypothetical membrane protein